MHKINSKLIEFEGKRIFRLRGESKGFPSIRFELFSWQVEIRFEGEKEEIWNANDG